MTRLETLQGQLEQNIAALGDIKAKRSADGSFPADVTEQLKRCNDDYIRIAAEIETEKIIEKREKDAVLMKFHERAAQTSTTSPTAQPSYEQVFWRHLMRQDSAQPSNLTPDERRVLETRGTATQITTSDSLGGYLVPKQFSNTLENMLLWYAPMMQFCGVRDDTQSGGGVLEWPSGDDTASTGNINTAANQAASRTVADLAFGHITFGDWLIDSNIIKVSRSLMQDNRVNLLQEALLDDLSNRIGRTANSKFTTGTGTNEPYGLTTSVTNGYTAANAASITVTDLLRFQASVDYSYQQGPKVGWMMHQNTLAYLRGLDFSTATSHIFIPGNLAQGEPDRLLGKPIFINNNLTGTTNGVPVTATKHVYYGDFSKFMIRKIKDVSIERNDYLYWDQISVGFMGWMRADSRLLNANAIKYMVQA